MKKKQKTLSYVFNENGRGLKKWLIMTKLTLLLISLSLMQAMAVETYSQMTRLSLKIEDRSLEYLFNEIESESEFYFVYNKDLIDVEQKVSVLADDESIISILRNVLKGTNISFAVYNKHIVLSGIDESNKMNQQKSVSGKITNSSGMPLMGVTVVIKGTLNGTTTNIDGEYVISDISENDVLVFSFIGMKTQEIMITNQSILNVVMEDDAVGLEEVVAIGYGYVKKSDLTGAVSSVSGDVLADARTSNVMERAKGRIAGVDIVQNNPTPGASPTIRIRGNRSINAGNDPLFVIDGIPTSQGINDFNPNDIESLEVLKDASAVAIYGSRGANGVILITTKRGTSGKAEIESNNYYGVKVPYHSLEVMNAQQFAEFTRVAYGYDGIDNSNDETIFSPQIYENLQNGVDTDWLDLVLRNGMQREHQLSIKGGNKNSRYYFSGSYYNEEGVLKNSDFERFTLRTNLDADVTEKFKLGLSLSANTDERNTVPARLIFQQAITFNPITKPFDDEGNVIASPDNEEIYLKSPILNYVPNQYINETKGYRFFSNLFAEYSFSKSLNYRINFGIDYLGTRHGQFRGDYDPHDPLTEGSIENSTHLSYTVENILSYNNTFNEVHYLNAVGVFSIQNTRAETSMLIARDIPNAKSMFYNLGSANEITGIGSGLTEFGLLSYLGRINYRFKDRYLLSVSGRADGSSRLAEGNKWAFFPAASAAWIMSEEQFFNIEWFSFLKLRAGYGEVGNTAIYPYQTLGGLARSVYAWDEEQAFGYGNDRIANPALGWEVSKTANIGVDFGFWRRRLSGTLEYYITNTNNLLLNRQLPITSGYDNIIQNIGSTRNSGLEASLWFVVIDNSNFKWKIDANIFSNKEEITELFDGVSDDVGSNWFIGYPIQTFYDYKFDGIWQTDQAEEAALVNQKPGDIRIADVNGRDENGELTKQPDGNINADDRTILGSTVPDWSGGINNSFSYKGLKLSFLIYARQGQMIISSLHDFGANRWEGRTSGLVFDYWTPNNPSNEYPIPRKGSAPLYASALQYRDGSFVKVKNITLSYDFGRRLQNISWLQSMEVSVSAINPITFSDYKILDPESSNGIVGENISTSAYMVGLNLKF
jgi:TonB-linked SusC/RagA family outer membrane protein